ncbi:SagB-type dehydrogenase domain containing protein-containing protein [Desulfovibrio sp. X2]|uniref:SagB family peptide dehydrogenase n=1 Tax=Desulfovibrio sp. X2 TaxID=941449 RepID=UPI000358B39E|nr:SagB family peptide dehydrogenase [Desulfovibrio sp. X2]EPR37439.1 SagB-type dehydrogenase domain containing protein-containing protein [Desulfovibrio sp. X2]
MFSEQTAAPGENGGSQGETLLQATDHDRENVLGRTLDWPAMPAPYKSYAADVPTVPLPRPASWPEAACGEIFCGAEAAPSRPDAATVSTLLQLACGITASVRRALDEYHLRADASAGALYPCELYLAARGTAGLPDGLFAFAPERHALRLLRPGEVLAGQGLRAWLTVIPFRNAWKYRSRALRYLFLDSGHVLENLCGAARSLGLACSVTRPADPPAVADLLCVDPAREHCVAEIALGSGCPTLAESLPAPGSPHLPRASAVSPREKAYELVHQALDLPGMNPADAAAPGETATPIRSIPALSLPFAQAVLKRRSRRAYTLSQLPAGALAALTEALCGPAGPDCGLGLRLLVQNCPDRPDGVWLLDRSQGDTRGELTRLSGENEDAPHARLASAALGQAWMAKAGVLVCFSADVPAAERTFGPGALPQLLLQAGRLGQRVYLAAEALGVGACGVGAFYDQEAAAALGLDAAQGQGERLLYVVAFGPTAGH